MSVAEQMKGFWGVLVAVNNLDEAIQSYQKFGFEFLERTTREEWGIEVAQFKAGNGSIMEVLSPVAEDKQVAQAVRKFLDKHGEGVYQVSIHVADIDAVHNFLREKGVRLWMEPRPVPFRPSVRQMWVSPRSTHGVFLEFISR